VRYEAASHRLIVSEAYGENKAEIESVARRPEIQINMRRDEITRGNINLVSGMAEIGGGACVAPENDEIVKAATLELAWRDKTCADARGKPRGGIFGGEAAASSHACS